MYPKSSFMAMQRERDVLSNVVDIFRHKTLILQSQVTYMTVKLEANVTQGLCFRTILLNQMTGGGGREGAGQE